MKTKNWLKGLLGAVITGCATAVILTVVDPANFNLAEGADRLLNAAIVAGIFSGAMYLKQSPLPPASKSKGKAHLVAALLLPTFLIGCATSPSGNPVVGGHEFSPEQVQKDIKLIAKIGAREGCKQDKNVEAYLQSAVFVLTAALNDDQYDVEVIEAALRQISVKELRGDSAIHYISDALELYQNHAGDQVSSKIDKVKYLRPALTGLRDGIVEGLAQFNATNP